MKYSCQISHKCYKFKSCYRCGCSFLRCHSDVIHFGSFLFLALLFSTALSLLSFIYCYRAFKSTLANEQLRPGSAGLWLVGSAFESAPLFAPLSLCLHVSITQKKKKGLGSAQTGAFSSGSGITSARNEFIHKNLLFTLSKQRVRCLSFWGIFTKLLKWHLLTLLTLLRLTANMNMNLHVSV